MNYFVCSEFSLRAYAALPIRFKKMVEYYAYCCDHFLDDSMILLEVFSDKIFIQYPAKSGENGAMYMMDVMNDRYIYDPKGELDVLKEISISGKRLLELRYCNSTTHLTLDYIRKKEAYGY